MYIIESEPVQQESSNSSDQQLKVERLIAQNENSPTLDLSVKFLCEEHMEFLANAIRNNEVKT